MGTQTSVLSSHSLSLHVPFSSCIPSLFFSFSLSHESHSPALLCTRCFRAYYVIRNYCLGVSKRAVDDAMTVGNVTGRGVVFRKELREETFESGARRGSGARPRRRRRRRRRRARRRTRRIHIERKYPLLTLSTNEILALGMLYFHHPSITFV